VTGCDLPTLPPSNETVKEPIPVPVINNTEVAPIKNNTNPTQPVDESNVTNVLNVTNVANVTNVTSVTNVTNNQTDLTDKSDPLPVSESTKNKTTRQFDQVE
jgi:hypothetical protein